MTSLLSQCVHNARSLRNAQQAVSLFHTSSAALAARGRRNNKKAKPKPPPRPEFQRDGIPHEGRTPTVPSSRASRQFDPNGQSGRRSKGPLASPSAVSRREGSSREGFRSMEERSSRDAGRGREERGLGRGRGEARYYEGEGRRTDGGGAVERSHSPSSSFHRSVERASREKYRMAKQLDRVRFDNEHQFAGPASPRRATGTSTSMNANNRMNTGDSTNKPWRNYDEASYDADHPEPRREFSEFDRPLQDGAYDAPELKDEFFHPLDAVSPISPISGSTSTSKGKQRLSTGDGDADTVAGAGFTSPPLLPGLVSSLHELLGRDATPTPIQALSIRHLIAAKPAPVTGAPGWRQFLLASETGSGKSIAYLLPLLQHVKQAEVAARSQSDSPSVSKPNGPQRLYNPRGLIMAPTHELARQLTVFAKSLLRADDVKLRVLCASRANITNPTGRTAPSPYTTERAVENRDGRLQQPQTHPVDVVVGTPMKLLEMVRGRGFDALDEAEALARAEAELDARDERAARERSEDGEDLEGGEHEGKDGMKRRKVRRGRDRVVHFGKWRATPEMGLANVEWVVVDEADVLFDPDFQETTRALLADISAARGATLPASASTLPPVSPPSPAASPASSTHSEALDYPFNLILTSATIPKTLNGYLQRFHPRMLRLASPRLHRLPKALQTEYVGWTGGNKFADVLRRLRRVWAEDAASANATASQVGEDGRTHVQLSKVLVFCNKSAKVGEFAGYLAENGVKSVALTSASEQRLRGSNGHLSGFLKDTNARQRGKPAEGRERDAAYSDDVKQHAHVLVTTSLLSRGLDFAPGVKHVFIVDEPRNTIDFIHRAGRTGRAGERGKVVIFGKMAGRGSARTKEIRRRVSVLTKA